MASAANRPLNIILYTFPFLDIAEIRIRLGMANWSGALHGAVG
jgi:hypothetical protein